MVNYVKLQQKILCNLGFVCVNTLVQQNKVVHRNKYLSFESPLIADSGIFERCVDLRRSL